MRLKLSVATILATLLGSISAFAANDYSWCAPGPALTPNPSGNSTTFAVVSQVCSSTPSCCDTARGRWSEACVQAGSNDAVSGGFGDVCGGGAWAQAPISGANEFYPRDFNLMALTGNVALLQSVADPIATAGTFTMSGFSLNYRGGQPIALVALGNVSLTNGSVNGTVDYSAGYSATNVSFTNGSPPTAPVPSPIDFTGANGRLLAMSAALAGYPARGTVRIQFGGVTFTGTDPDLNVFSVSASSIVNATNYTYSVPASSHVIVNVTGTSPIIRNAGFSGASAANVLWNFPNATTLTMSSIGFPGSILAPSAVATLQNGQLTGTAVVASAPRATMSLGDAPFQMPGAPTVTSCGSGCLCADPTWSCSGNITLDGSGHAVGINPEAGFLQLDTETYKAEFMTRTSPRHRVWYSFQPAQSSPATKPLAVFFNGGPGSGTSPLLFAFNTAPMTLDPQRTGGAAIATDPDSWTQFANLLYIDAPDTGFSYPVSVSGSQADVGTDMDRDAGMFVSVIMRFLLRHPALQATSVIIVGESYGGSRAQFLLNDIYDYGSLTRVTAAYNDAQVSADEAAYFTAVFGTATPTVAQVATKFNREFLIEPVVVGKQQYDDGQSTAPGTGCINSDPQCWQSVPPHLGNCDPYNCDQPANWSTNLETSAVQSLVSSVATLNTALGVDATTIQWLYASQRTGAYKHNSTGSCFSSPALTSTFGALGSNDCYLLTLNDNVTEDYGAGTSNMSQNWDTDVRGIELGQAFADNLLSGVRTFITVSAFDRVVWTPSIPDAYNQVIGDGDMPILASVLYQPGTPYTPPLSALGQSLFNYTAGVTEAVAMPVYQAGHTVTQRTPAALLADAIVWSN